MAPPPPDPTLIGYHDTAKYLGICRRRLLTEMVRLGALPRPDSWLRWKRVDVEAARAWLYSTDRGPPPATSQ